MKNESWLDNAHAALRTLTNVKDRLEGLSWALGRVGNERLAGEVSKYADTVFEAREQLDAAVSAAVNEQYRDAMQITSNVLDACLAIAAEKAK